MRGRLVLNEVVYAELSVRLPSMELLERFVEDVPLTFEPTPRPALFAAGKVFHRYRSRGCPRASLLPDFFVGAHAAVLGVPLLTRDPRRYRTYFPTLALIAP